MGTRVIRLTGVAVVSLAVALGQAPGAAAEGGARPDARREAAVTIGNFGRVDARLYRGEQPRSHEYRQLASLGVRTVVDLRRPNARARADAEAAGLKYLSVTMRRRETPTDREAAAFLRAVTAPGNAPVFVHCAGGKHRTGSLVAVYRIAVHGWTAEQAYEEMLRYGFYSRFGHGVYRDFVFDYYARRRKSEGGRQKPEAL